MKRNWTTVGEDLVAKIGRDEVEQAAAEMDWQTVPTGGSLTVGFMPGEAINTVIRELGLPKVSAVSIHAICRPATSPDEDGFYPGFYGIEANYKDGRARIFVLDTGVEVTPLFSDFYGDVDAAAAAA